MYPVMYEYFNLMIIIFYSYFLFTLLSDIKYVYNKNIEKQKYPTINIETQTQPDFRFSSTINYKKQTNTNTNNEDEEYHHIKKNK